MKPSAAIPIPARMAHLPLDRRGYPIPFIVFRDEHGNPHFTVNEESLRQQVITEDRCSICGGKLLRGRWFAGGPASAFHEHGAYLDPPMHGECARYALQVCPYLAAPNYSRRIEDKTLRAIGSHEPVAIDEAVDNERPDYFVAVMASGQRPIYGELIGIKMVRYLRPRRPYMRVEYWRDGQQIEPPISAAG